MKKEMNKKISDAKIAYGQEEMFQRLHDTVDECIAEYS
jgi:hypothetical protein